MKRFIDPAYLRGEQYKNSTRLNARAEMHRRFSTNPQGWLPWAFEQLAPHLNGRVLEVGGGPGWLWRENLDRLPPDLRLCYSDFSAGMAAEARQALGHIERFGFCVIDAQALPLAAGACRLVIANHMLYHVPDLAQAARELARVLAPGGCLFAATNGEQHLDELHALVREFEPRYTGRPVAFISGFMLENAAERLAPVFERVEIRRYPDALWVTEARPMVDYVLSMSRTGEHFTPEQARGLEAFFQAKIEAEGGVRITKDAGLVIAYPV